VGVKAAGILGNAMNNNNYIDTINKKTMRSAVAQYSVVPNTWSDKLTPAEKEALAAIADEARNKPILDLGVGAGRTVKPLLEISNNYVGVDYIHEMVEECRNRFPGVNFVQADARGLSQFKDNSFFLIVFSCNGICMVDHKGRLAILREVHRLLEPGGVFIFQTYNRDSFSRNTFINLPDFQPTNNPAKFIMRGIRFLSHTMIRIINRLRFKRFEQHCGTYAIKNDACHDYATMLYYISVENQCKQLDTIGFRKDVQIFDSAGQTITAGTKENDFTLLVRK